MKQHTFNSQWSNTTHDGIKTGLRFADKEKFHFFLKELQLATVSSILSISSIGFKSLNRCKKAGVKFNDLFL